MENPKPAGVSAGPPRALARLVVAIVIGAVCGLVTWMATRRPGFLGQDFQLWWFAANALLEHRDPYTTIFFAGRPGYLYPLTTALIAVPVAVLPVTIAASLFIAVSCGLLAFVVTERAWWPLLMFASGSVLASAYNGQISPLLAIGLFRPRVAWLGALKPNIGLAIFAYRPSWRMIAIGGALTVSTLILLPTWPLEWIRNVRGSSYHYAPVLAFGGPLLLLALTRWRRPEGRLLAAMALLPSTPGAYEVLPLFVIPKTRVEMLVLVVGTLVAQASFLGVMAPEQLDILMARGRWAVVWCCYLPALAMLLRRRNEGPAPAWLDRALDRAPRWLRGQPVPT